MARRRYQKGSLILKGTREKVWYARWLDDVIKNGQTIRVHRSQKLGSLADIPTKQQARKAMEQVVVLVNSSNCRPTVQTRFSEFVKKWEQSVLPQHKPSSQSSERMHLEYHLLPRLGAIAMEDVTAENLQNLISSLSLAPKTIRNILDTLRTIWKTAKAWGYVHHNPFDGLTLPRLSPQQQPMYSAEQTRQIISKAEEPYRTMFWIVAETGIRGGEACGLKVEDISLDDQTLTVRRTAWRGRLQSPKTENAVRCLPISGELAQHLRGFMESVRVHADGLLFVTRSGRALDNSNVVKEVLRPITNALGLPKAGLHALRHGNATMLDRMGVPVAIRRERLGHAQFATTLRYTHAMSADHRRVAAELGPIFCPSLPQPPTALERELAANETARSS